MAGEWVKMRVSLLSHPKVIAMARTLGDARGQLRALTTGFDGALHELVTPSVTVAVTVCALLRVWGAANEHTTDGFFNRIVIDDLDDIAGVAGFGKAMQSVGWAVFDSQHHGVLLPNFDEYNTSADRRSAGAKSAAERQRDWRARRNEKRNGESNEKRNGESNEKRNALPVTVTTEKRREEKRLTTTTLTADTVGGPRDAVHDEPAKPTAPQKTDKPKKPRELHWSEPHGSRLHQLLKGFPDYPANGGVFPYVNRKAREHTQQAVLGAMAESETVKFGNWKHFAAWLETVAKSKHEKAGSNGAHARGQPAAFSAEYARPADYYDDPEQADG